MKILSAVGARPQFIKLAPIDHAITLSGRDITHQIVHTGQHYDSNMSEVFFSGLGIAPPEMNLAVGSGTHGRQTGAMLARMDECIETLHPDLVLVYGDTNSTVAAALSAVKYHVPVAHLEAGLRSFNRRMPEEHNRVLTDHMADLCLAPSEAAMEHLATEGLERRSTLVGDVMTDICLQTASANLDNSAASSYFGRDGFYLATFHRADNTDDPLRLDSIIRALDELDYPVVLTAHPRLVAKAAEHGVDLKHRSIHVVPPMDYAALVGTLRAARGVITDSGGLQKEAFLVRTPCTTVRTETEWVETLDLGWNQLVPSPSDVPRAVATFRPSPTTAQPYGDGHAAERVVDALLSFD